MEGARNGHTEVVAVLARNGADVRVQNKNTWTAAHYAAQVCGVATRLLLPEYARKFRFQLYRHLLSSITRTRAKHR